MRQRIDRWFPREYRYTYEYDLSPWHRRTITVRGGALPWWQEIVNYFATFMLLIFCGALLGRCFDGAFASLWLMLALMGAALSPNARLKLFKVPDRVDTTEDRLIENSPTEEEWARWESRAAVEGSR